MFWDSSRRFFFGLRFANLETDAPVSSQKWFGKRPVDRRPQREDVRT
jgi:hypothetical protein